MLTGGIDGTWLHALDTGRLLGRFVDSGSTDTVSCSPSQNRVFTSGVKGRLIWDATDGKLVHRLGGATSPIRTAVWSSDGDLIMVSDDNSAHIWDAWTGRFLHDFARGPVWISAGAWSPDSSQVVTVDGHSDVAYVRDTRTGRVLKELRGQFGPFNAVAWSPNGQWIAISSNETSTFFLWNAGPAASPVSSTPARRPSATWRGLRTPRTS